MGHCQNMEDQLFSYIDDELDALQRKEIKRHLEGCKECARFAEQIGTLRKSMQDIRKVDASDRLIVNLRECIRKEQMKKENKWTTLFTTRKWVPAVGFVAVFIIAGAFIFDNQSSGPKTYSNSSESKIQLNKAGADRAAVASTENNAEKAVVAQDTVIRHKNLNDIQSKVTPVNY